MLPLGYLFLDTPDHHRIDTVGLYLCTNSYGRRAPRLRLRGWLPSRLPDLAVAA
ncbi:hypothetical protein ABTZ03_41020 [Kitasatospora sp. NPDC096077]|uniref:hypothetical protein n=1 Tax=Kitasatospora sp. NPDC096077 TaxID=3155544 RepID=UPI003320C4E6